MRIVPKQMHRSDPTIGDGPIAYLVNKYPLVSHSFVRREILALERLGIEVVRISIRGWDEVLVEPEDINERKRTAFVLKHGPLPLLWASVAQAVAVPLRFLSAMLLAFRMMRSSDRPALWHLIYLAEACWIVRYLRARGINRLHAHFGTNPANVAMLISELANIPYSFTAHGPEEFDRARSLHLAEKIRRAAFVVAVSSYGRSQMYRILPPREWNKIKLVHCGVDNSFAEIEAPAYPHASRFVCVGRLCEQKGQLLLVKAVADLIKAGHQLELVLVGDGEHRPLIEQMVREEGVSDRIGITGWASARQVKEEILRSRAMVLPSFAEGLPIVIIEAMLLAKPVLSTYVAGIPELVRDGVTGWLFPAGSRSALKAAIKSCLETPDETLVAMGQAGRARAMKRHSVEWQAHRLRDLFAASATHQCGVEKASPEGDLLSSLDCGHPVDAGRDPWIG